jgi:hypothetical protein
MVPPKPWRVIDPPPLYSWRLTSIFGYFRNRKKILSLIFLHDPPPETNFNPCVHRFFSKELPGHSDPAGNPAGIESALPLFCAPDLKNTIEFMNFLRKIYKEYSATRRLKPTWSGAGICINDADTRINRRLILSASLICPAWIMLVLLQYRFTRYPGV